MKKDIDWSKLGFGYTPTDFRFQAEWKDGKWSEGKLISDPNIELSDRKSTRLNSSHMA